MNPKIEPVDGEIHRDLRVVPSFTFEHAKTSQFMPLNASEFGAASTCYPIFLIKDSHTAKFFAAALFGIDENENLFYSSDRWLASYVPKLMNIVPFSIGRVKGAEGEKKWAVCIDRNSSYLSTDEGELLFANGDETPYLKRVSTALAELNQEKIASLTFIDRMLDLDLIKPVQFNLEYQNGNRRVIGGLYTIKAEEVAELSGEQASEFHSKGYFSAIYALLHSQHNMFDLMRMKRAKGGEPLASLQIADRA